MSAAPYPYLGHGGWLPPDDTYGVHVAFVDVPRALPAPPFPMEERGSGRHWSWRAAAATLADSVALGPSERGQALRLGLDERSVAAVESAMRFADRDAWRAIADRLDAWLDACHAISPIGLVVRPAQLSTHAGTRAALAHAALYDASALSAHHHASLADVPSWFGFLADAPDELVGEVVALVGDAPPGPEHAPLLALAERVPGGDRTQRGLLALMALATPTTFDDRRPLVALTFLLRSDFAAHFAASRDCATSLQRHLTAFAASATSDEAFGELSFLIQHALWPTRENGDVHDTLTSFLIAHAGRFDGERFAEVLDGVARRAGPDVVARLDRAVRVLAPWRPAMARGREALTTRDDAAAEASFREAVASRDALPEAWTALARLALWRGALDEAQAAVDRAITLSGGYDLQSLVVSAEIHLVRGEAQAALAAIEPVTVRWGSDGRAHLVRAVALWALGRKSAARAAAKKAAHYLPDWPRDLAGEPWFEVARPLVPAP